MMIEFICYCGTPFTPRIPWQKYCSPECKQRANGAARTKRRALRIKQKPKKSGKSLPARLDLVVIRAWRNADEYTRAKIAALNPRMQFVEEI